MIVRKAEKYINNWIMHPKRALLVTGARQVGKTYAIRKCLTQSNCNYIEINLIENPEFILALKQSASIEELKLNISALKNVTFVDNESYLFIDEVQECADIITKIKFWVDDGRIKFILSGSLLGVELKNLRSAPVGYVEELNMYPLDFEEFLMASNVTLETIDYLKNCFLNLDPITDVINNKMFAHLNRYLVVGGMPGVVADFIKHNDFFGVRQCQAEIEQTYIGDMALHAPKGMAVQIQFV